MRMSARQRSSNKPISRRRPLCCIRTYTSLHVPSGLSRRTRRQLGYASLVALSVRFAFGPPQTMHVVLTSADLASNSKTERAFVGKLARLPSTLKKMTLARDVLDDGAAKAGHLDALCNNWPTSLQAICFQDVARSNVHLVLPFEHWRLPPRLVELRIKLLAYFPSETSQCASAHSLSPPSEYSVPLALRLLPVTEHPLPPVRGWAQQHVRQEVCTPRQRTTIGQPAELGRRAAPRRRSQPRCTCSSA
jgi:hypothetical protein